MTASIWPIITVVGPILLIAALIWAFMRNRNAPRSSVARAEQGAEDLRERINDEEVRSGDA